MKDFCLISKSAEVKTIDCILHEINRLINLLQIGTSNNFYNINKKFLIQNKERLVFGFVLDDLSRTIRLVAKYIDRDWHRLYWQIPFHPTRGQEELSKDIKLINEKYQRGDVLQVNISL